MFHFNIRFSTIGTRNVKKGKRISIETNDFFILSGTSQPATLRSIFSTIDFLVHKKFIRSNFSCIILIYNLEL